MLKKSVKVNLKSSIDSINLQINEIMNMTDIADTTTLRSLVVELSILEKMYSILSYDNTKK